MSLDYTEADTDTQIYSDEKRAEFKQILEDANLSNTMKLKK